jgi:hypothetical protein
VSQFKLHVAKDASKTGVQWIIVKKDWRREGKKVFAY